MRIFNFIKYLYFICIAILVLGLSACGDSHISNKYSYTVLVYMEGTDLEESAYALMTANIKEMLNATPSDKIVIVLTTGAANKAVPADPVKSWKTMKRHRIENGAITELMDLGVKDMGDPANLTDFIVWGQLNYTADRYILIFSDHGGGALYGFGSSMTTPKLTSMTIAGIRTGIADAVARTGIKFEIIGFDACLMATVEVAYLLKDLSYYFAASEETEPGWGWDWKVFINYLAANPHARGDAVGRVIADSYFEKAKTTGEDGQVTFSITDLSKMQAVADALAGFSLWQQGLLDGRGVEAWTDLAFARSRSLDFFNSNLTRIFMDMVDFLNMIDRDGFQSPQTTAVKDAVANAVIYKVAGSLRQDSRGLSIMFPTGSIWNQDNMDLYQTFPFVPEYQALINKFVTIGKTAVPDKVISNPVLIVDTITSNISPADTYYEQAYVVMSDTIAGKTIIYGHQPIWSSFTGKLDYKWDGKWFTLNGCIVSIIAEPSTEAVVDLRIPIEANNVKGVYFLRYNFTDDTTTFLGFRRAVMDNFTNQPYRGFEQLPPGTVIKPLVYEIDNSSWLSNKWVTGTTQFTIPAGGLEFAKTNLPSGTYNIGFVVEDLRLKPSFSNLISVVK